MTSSSVLEFGGKTEKIAEPKVVAALKMNFPLGIKSLRRGLNIEVS